LPVEFFAAARVVYRDIALVRPLDFNSRLFLMPLLLASVVALFAAISQRQQQHQPAPLQQQQQQQPLLPLQQQSVA
jgi:energy-converting hydrogenase Eha subunit F